MIFYKLNLFKTIWLVPKSIFYLMKIGFKLSTHTMKIVFVETTLPCN